MTIVILNYFAIKLLFHHLYFTGSAVSLNRVHILRTARVKNTLFLGSYPKNAKPYLDITVIGYLKMNFLNIVASRVFRGSTNATVFEYFITQLLRKMAGAEIGLGHGQCIVSPL